MVGVVARGGVVAPLRPGALERCLHSYRVAVGLVEEVRSDLGGVARGLSTAREVPAPLRVLGARPVTDDPGLVEGAMAAQARVALMELGPVAARLSGRVGAAREQLGSAFMALASLPSCQVPPRLLAQTCDVAVNAHVFEVVLRMIAPAVAQLRIELETAREHLDAGDVAAAIAGCGAARSAAQAAFELTGAIGTDPTRREWISEILKGLDER